MKKLLFFLTSACFFTAAAFSIPKNKAITGLYMIPFERNVAFSKNGLYSEDDSKNQFGGAYIWGDIIQGNNYVTAAGKIYYRFNSLAEGEEASQKIDLKRAYIKVRPAGTDLFEIAAGKLYSYHLDGGFFNLAEHYTGSCRWGKTGIGSKLELSGFTAGLALPVTESYTTFSDSSSLAASLSYDFSFLNSNLPLKTGFSAVQNFTEKDFAFSASALYSQNFSGLISRMKVFLSYSHNSEPYVASSVFKNVSNYNTDELKKANFTSVNLSLKIGTLEIIEEGEAGHSVNGDYIPLYSGTQFLIPLTDFLALKPRFFYYAALNAEDSSLGRQSFELYPRLWFTFGKCNVSAGAIFSFVEASSDKNDSSKSDWYYGCEVPLFAEWKF